MDDTGSGHEELPLRKAEIEPHDPRNSTEFFCTYCIKIMLQTTPEYIQLHDSAADVKECGKRCGLCHYIYSAFGDYVIEGVGLKLEDDQIPCITVSVEDWNKPLSELGQTLRLSVSVNKSPESKGPRTSLWVHRTFAASAISARGINRAIWNHPGPVDFSSRVPTILQWIQECQTHHVKCQSTLPPGSRLAARILEVHTESREPTLRLTPTDSLDLHKTPYLVLSHCWGDVKIHCITTHDNLSNYYSEIDISTLPKTFRDAIKITRALRFRYLWIDSLCIIQDSYSDWEAESAKMASIFRGATLTISASSARNSSEGCGITTNLASAIQFPVATRNHPPGQPQAFFAIRDCTLHSDFPSRCKFLNDCPVHERAWIFQEKTLSRCILHCTHTMFVWQCATHIETEDGLDYYKDRSGSGPWEILGSHVAEHVVKPAYPTKGYKDIRDLWWHWVKDYMTRKLKYKADTYAALAGVINLYQDLTGDTPVLGLWKRDLPLHLGWSVHDTDAWDARANEEMGERRPSWTWMSFLHGTVTPHLSDSKDWDGIGIPASRSELKRSAPCYKVEVLDIDIRWAGHPLISSPSHAALKLRGLQHRLPPLEPRTGRGLFQLDPDVKYMRNDRSEFDVFALFAFEQEGTLITHPPRLHTVWLVVDAINRDEGIYRRIGRYLTCDPIAADSQAEEILLGTYQTIELR